MSQQSSEPNNRFNDSLELLDLNEDGEVNFTIKNHALVGKVLSEVAAKHLTINAILRKAWKFPDLECHDLGKNIFLFVFQSLEERLRVLGNRPWAVQDRLLVLKEWLPEVAFEELDFTTEDFRIQVHNLTITLITPKNIKKIGSLFSRCYGSNFNKKDKVKWDGHLNIRVAIRVEDPLKIGFILNRKSYKPLEVCFKYEQIPKFCYKCGRIGHGEKECWHDMSFFKLSGRFRPWLRATHTWKERRTLNPLNTGEH
ncbi:hypothetical protein like AT2G17920 [Hibiscus trionum]|uniref:CCHC-type domain-containing protein n=1 Tax=Hibiscus trionum TaxID=183268 RepID=A0A9W7I4J0_HIBTR|nr:hypothetical protein like AT2G17920 [Hibiscus trionum]